MRASTLQKKNIDCFTLNGSHVSVHFELYTGQVWHRVASFFFRFFFMDLRLHLRSENIHVSAHSVLIIVHVRLYSQNLMYMTPVFWNHKNVRFAVNCLFNNPTWKTRLRLLNGSLRPSGVSISKFFCIHFLFKIKNFFQVLSANRQDTLFFVKFLRLNVRLRNWLLKLSGFT